MSKLGDFVRVQGGYAFKSSELSDDKTGVPVIKIGNITGGSFVDLSNYQSVSFQLFEKTKSFATKDNDILIAMTGANVGKTSRVPVNSDAYLINQRVGRFLLKEDCPYTSDFIYYVVSSKQAYQYFSRVADGAAQPNISGKTIEDLEFPNIDSRFANKIGNILKSLDDKIQLNTQINQTLEQIAQTIFKSWFIDFDPVHAKANALASGQTAEQATQAAMAVISGKNTQELHRLQTANLEQYQQLWEIAEAFPSGFDEEGVPWGWEEKSFGELLENTIGGDWGKDEVDEKHTEKVSILRGTDLPDVYKGNDKDVPTRFVEQKKLKSRKLQHSDIVIEVSGGSKNQPTGRSLLITDKLLSRFNNPIVPASFCRLFRPKSENYGYLLALHLQIIYQQGKTWEYQNQSTGISNFQTTHFLETEKVILPTNKTLMYFAEMVYPIFDKIYSNENQKLTEIRDELLPKLLSGEILNGN
ncbi:type I restriction modification DNA specificity domain protein [Glaesserella parasuis 174]|uniref:restriction endonuclease subunit S n=1 Tax=Glaesserella parasuis TaxID=738 RepID=UPI0003ABD5DB|nr:restriction endonuclease subunit S [Glaesserella parasuis]EQA15178.1 type I restriction modification DNA specificity domain protein [Glaesserella parasuis 174]MDD2169861.1 restriction endonuclease subunit S [Glaesserella parasuis]MDP0406113.1 restriction endonuclease subunit S [Glaesserella parasuis]QIE72240.1 restriction endonuclease subunit S [Glaesserella parasuis]